MSQTYSDLQVVPDKLQHYSDLQVTPDRSLPEVASAPEYRPYEVSKPYQVTKPGRRICGFSARGFWITVGTVVLVLAAGATGAAVGVTQGAKSEEANQADNATDATSTSTSTSTSLLTSTTAAGSTSTSATTTSVEAVTVTTTEEIGPTQTLSRDCPSSNYTIYEALGSEEYQFRKICNAAFHWSGDNVVNQKASSLNDCINLCVAYNVKNQTEIGKGNSNVCNGVCWRNSLDDPDWPGQCFGATIQNSSSTGFPMTTETKCDSAGWINQKIG